MREYIGLYRGKRIDNDEWIEGCLVKKIDPMLDVKYCFILAQEYDTSCIDGQPTHLNSFMTWYKVDPETVGEYTGLIVRGIYSAYGKKIFEGDILRFRYTGENRGVDGVAAVIFEDGKFGVKWGWHSELVALTGFANTSIEIIGNIHDNPELLEAADG